MHLEWRGRIVVDPELHHGEPCIRGTRIPVYVIVSSLADGMSEEELLEQYPQLTREDIRAALAYVAELLQHEMIIELSGQK
ncbi:DUF433 domain-containing protein [Thermoflexus hugenholtzii]|uniref:Uncharacterized conserved protein, DUF433 family n=1 Tax=Thermoflexus hugenholtzii JAD2 TaxID=877466 RepID=A0A212RMB8_9CHLR|nr:DUF433 domain-containing protein [Thermoflexus hugenholtzii]SNB73586.1 Uncharacterized conserved protein, DUF433 family [Thermoflexus hugenholtzii JAD2]